MKNNNDVELISILKKGDQTRSGREKSKIIGGLRGIMKIKRRILSGLCAVSLALGMSKTKSDAKIISYAADVCWGANISLGCLFVFDFCMYEYFKKETKLFSKSLFVLTNVLGLMDYVNRMVDAKHVQNLEAELQKLKDPDKKVNKTTDGKNVDSKEPKQI